MFERVTWAGLLVLAVMAGPAAAAEAAHGESISIFTGNIGNAIWTLLIFVLVLVVLGRFAWGPILAGLQRREQFIRESLETAKRERELAEARHAEWEKKLTEARDQASAIVEEGRRDAETVRRRIEDEARTSAEALIERARREIGVARDTALRELYERSTDLAMTMAGTVLRRQVSPEDHQNLVQEALAQLEQPRN